MAVIALRHALTKSDTLTLPIMLNHQIDRRREGSSGLMTVLVKVVASKQMDPAGSAPYEQGIRAQIRI